MINVYLFLQPFWTAHPFFDPTTCLPPDRMHQADQGLFKTMMGWAVNMLEKVTFTRGGGKAQQRKVCDYNRL
jgi:hypothetical protein